MRAFSIRNVYILLLFLFTSACQNEATLESTVEQKVKVPLVQADGKKPMILLTDRPANLETPLRYFLEDFTPNDVFFVRWHSSNMPVQMSADTFRLYINGHVKKELALSLEDLKTKFQPYTINALCLCAGNARSCFNPRVPGAQWVNGGMGNAKWKGVKLKDVLEMAGAKSSSRFVSFNGLDNPPMPGTPDFVKSLSYSHAADGEVMIAYEMNGESLPILNGFPLKLVVPGWYATYWVGMLSEIKVHADSFHGFWMDKAYQSPKGISNGDERPDSLAKVTEPVNKIAARSIFVSPEPDTRIKSGSTTEVNGLAFDSGNGIEKVEISTDSGKVWMPATLDSDLGKYSWRRWRYQYKATEKGKVKLYVKATTVTGETQPWHQWNRSGYMKNEIETLELNIQD